MERVRPADGVKGVVGWEAVGQEQGPAAAVFALSAAKKLRMLPEHPAIQ